MTGSFLAVLQGLLGNFLPVAAMYRPTPLLIQRLQLHIFGGQASRLSEQAASAGSLWWWLGRRGFVTRNCWQMTRNWLNSGLPNPAKKITAPGQSEKRGPLPFASTPSHFFFFFFFGVVGSFLLVLHYPASKPSYSQLTTSSFLLPASNNNRPYVCTYQ